MTERQLTFEQDDIAQMVNSAYDQLRAGRFAESIELLERAMELDVEFAGVTATLKCARFWSARQSRVSDLSGPRARADYLLSQWRAFREFAARISDLPERCRHDIRYYAHSAALAYLLEEKGGATKGDTTNGSETDGAGNARAEQPPAQARARQNEASINQLIGRCYRAMGDFEHALDYLERARHDAGDSAKLYAELADCYALINDSRTAKIFFREAFFLAADEVGIEDLESPLIRQLVGHVADAGISEHVAEWVPVYGAAHGTLSVRRELRPLEYGRLKQAIFELEKRLSSDVEDSVPHTLPRLLNRYFWLMDHYSAAGEEARRVEDVLDRLRTVAPDIYELYLARVGARPEGAL